MELGVALLALTGCGPTFDTPCQSNADCRIRPESCCGSRVGCGEVFWDDAIALHRDDVMAYRDVVCADHPYGCYACIADEPYAGLGVACVDRRCVLRDIRYEPIAACELDTDCALASIDGSAWWPSVVAYNPSRGSLDEFFGVPAHPLSTEALPDTSVGCTRGHCTWDDDITPWIEQP